MRMGRAGRNWRWRGDVDCEPGDGYGEMTCTRCMSCMVVYDLIYGSGAIHVGRCFICTQLATSTDIQDIYCRI